MNRALLGKVGYGLAFAVALPLLLAAWTRALPLPLPVLHAPRAGALLVLLGGGLLAWAMAALWFQGGGLPMNAFPPPRLVRSGPFRILSHPIYVGFVLACAGVALAAGSATGLWLTTPLAALGCTALVLGYEAPSLDRRFGPDRPRPLLALPAPAGGPPALRERLGAAVLVLGLWLLAYLGLQLLGPAPDAVPAHLPGESGWPLWVPAEALYASAYLGVPAAFLLAPGRAALRRLAVQGLAAIAGVSLCYLCLPLVASPRPFEGTGLFAALLRFEHGWTWSAAASFPSFHVVWAGLAAHATAGRGPAWRAGAWTWAVLVAASCVLTGMHALLDVAAAMLLWVPLVQLERLWSALLRAAERLANGWRGWRLGPLRILNHSRYPGLAAALGFLGATALQGHPAGVAVVAGCVLLGAGLAAYRIEGSPQLARPFGFQGGLLGASLAALVLAFTPWGGWPLAASLCMVAPLVQAVGRLRCLVQGCCHGAPTAADRGIRVREPHSRVSLLAHLAEVPIHPTPLYSILGNLAIAALLARLWTLHAPAAFLVGAYLVLSGLARFMEEAYRGEPQTPVAGGLHLYQWAAAATVAAGMAVVLLPSPAVPQAVLPGAAGWTGALLCGAAFAFALGMDFPDSQRRFARLSG